MLDLADPEDLTVGRDDRGPNALRADIQGENVLAHKEAFPVEFLNVGGWWHSAAVPQNVES